MRSFSASCCRPQASQTYGTANGSSWSVHASQLPFALYPSEATLIGYAAAGHGIHAGALALFLILFVWQFPHFDAIAWLYRDDYARAGIRMLPVIEPDGESTGRRIVVCSLLLIPISLLPRFLAMTGTLYTLPLRSPADSECSTSAHE